MLLYIHFNRRTLALHVYVHFAEQERRKMIRKREAPPQMDKNQNDQEQHEKGDAQQDMDEPSPKRKQAKREEKYYKMV